MSATEYKVPNDLVTGKQLAEMRPTSEKQFRLLRQDGRLAVWKLGRRVYYSLADYDALLTREVE